MKNSCLVLLKVQLINQYKLNNLVSKQNSKEKSRVIMMAIIFIILGGVLMLYSFGLGFGLGMLGAANIIPGYAVMITGIITLFFTMIKSNGVIFGYRDYDMLMSLPVKTGTIITSKFLSMYVMNTLFTTLVMLPMGIAYCVFEKPSVLFYFLWLIGMLTSSLVPTTIATVAGAVIIAISSRFKHTTAVATILSFVLLLGFMGGSMRLGNQDVENIDVNQLANLGKLFSEQINKIYPLSWLYTKGVVEMSLYHFTLYLVISLGWYYLFVKAISIQYKKLNTSLMTYQAKSNYKLRELKVQPPIYALYKKEMKRFFSSTLYVLNVGFGVVMMIATAIACFIMGPEKLAEFMQVEGMVSMFNKIIPFALSVMLTMTCTTSVSLSLEGKNLWILKSSPIQDITIFHSKILVNLTLLLPTAILSSLLIATRFPMDVISFLLLLIVPIAYSVFTSVWGMYINIKMPNYEWVSETAVIKQGMASMIGMLGGAVFAAIPIGIILIFNQIDYRISQSVCMVLIIGFTMLLYHKVRKSKI